MMNLKEETLAILDAHGKGAKDVRWVGGDDFAIPIDTFWRLADQEYDDGYGAQEVAADLIVVGDDFWLERYEYDGAERWDYKAMPQKPDRHEDVATIIGRDVDQYWASLARINGIAGGWMEDIVWH